MTASVMGGLMASFRNPGYARYTFGNFASMTGTWMQRMAVAWLTWEMTHSTIWLGIIAFSDLAPSMVVTPLGGALADRVDRIRAVILVQSLALLIVIGLLVSQMMGVLDISILIVFVCLLGIINGFDLPIRQSLIGDIVTGDNLPEAVAISAMSFNFARMLGPALAGLVITLGGVGPVFAINAASFMFFIWIALRLNPVRRDRPTQRDSILSDIIAGLRLIWRDAFLRFVMIMLFTVSALIRPVFELLPALTGRMEVLASGSAVALSILTSTLGIGAVLGVLAAPFLRVAVGLRYMLIGSAFATAISLMCFAIVEQALASLISLGLVSFFVLINSVGIQVAVHTGTPAEFRGRTLSVQGLIFRGAPAIGALGMGVLGSAFGLQVTLLAGGVVALLLLLPWSLVKAGTQGPPATATKSKPGENVE